MKCNKGGHMSFLSITSRVVSIIFYFVSHVMLHVCFCEVALNFLSRSGCSKTKGPTDQIFRIN